MHVQEKQAWFILAITGAALALALLLIAIFGFSPLVFAAFGIFFLGFFTPLIGRRERKAGMVTMDERDKQIGSFAAGGAYAVFWLLFVLTAMGLFVMGPHATITLRTATISSIMFAAGGLVFVVWALIIVVLYRRDGRA